MEKQKRTEYTRTKEQYREGAIKASLKLKGMMTGSKNPYAKKIKVDGIAYGSIVEALSALNVSSYKLKKYHNVEYL